MCQNLEKVRDLVIRVALTYLQMTLTRYGIVPMVRDNLNLTKTACSNNSSRIKKLISINKLIQIKMHLFLIFLVINNRPLIIICNKTTRSVASNSKILMLNRIQDKDPNFNLLNFMDRINSNNNKTSSNNNNGHNHSLSSQQLPLVDKQALECGECESNYILEILH